MPSLARGQPNTNSILNWFITVGGVPTDAFAVEFKILDIRAGVPGTQVFPSTGYHTVTAAPGHFGVGSYYAYNNTGAVGWTPAVDQPLGQYRAEWRWKLASTSQHQVAYEDFTITESLTAPSDTYISVQDIRDEGLDSSVASDLKVSNYIRIWQAFLERACRQWFLPKTITLRCDGSDSDALHFGVPIISIEYVKLNGDTNVLDPTFYKTYLGVENGMTDGRRDPKIKLVGKDEEFSIYTAPIIMPHRALKFRKGRQNQEVKGVFGYVEDDGSVPPMIKRALTKLVIEKLTTPMFGSSSVPPPPILAAVLEEETDGHRRKYAGVETSPAKPGLSGITKDPEILTIIKMYKAPIGIATPAHFNYS